MDYLSILTETYKEYNTKIVPQDDHDLFVIINPYWNENIEIEVYNDDSGDDLIFNFYCHHEHFNRNADKLIEYVNYFLNGEYVAYKFFRDEKEVSRGFREMDSIDTYSGTSILDSLIDSKSYWEQLGPWGAETYDSLYKQYAGESGHGSFTFSIYGWNTKHSKDIDFVL